jgi:hypothetical protein
MRSIHGDSTLLDDSTLLTAMTYKASVKIRLDI